MKAVARFALLAALTALIPACAKEDPTEIGASLVENGAVRTFEVTLDGSQYLVRDTAFAAFPPPLSSFFILANTFEGELNAHILAKFKVDPFYGVAGSGGTIIVDSVPRLQRGVVVLKFDTIASARNGPVLLRLYRAAETWDTAAVTWTVRQLNGTTPVLWFKPGGTRGALLDTATWSGGDSVVFRVDTATLKLWRDSAATSPGILITDEQSNSRLRTTMPVLRVYEKTTIGDSVVSVSATPFASRFISDPVPPFASTDPRVGGAPKAYRSVLQVRSDLNNISIPCPFTPTCHVRLGDATIASADILLQPVASPAGFVPELPLTVLAYTLAPTAQVPLVRSPLGVAAGFTTIAPGNFRNTGVAPAALNVTTFVRDIVAPIDTLTFQSRYLTLLPGGTATFGYGTFAAQPKLRLRLSVAQEIQLP